MSARTWTVTGLLVGAAGLVGQRIAGVAMPVVPPGLVLLIIAAALLVATRWRWVPVAGVVVAATELVACVVGAAKLVDFTEFGVAASSWVRLVGVAVAVVAGVAATVAAYREVPA